MTIRIKRIAVQDDASTDLNHRPSDDCRITNRTCTSESRLRLRYSVRALFAGVFIAALPCAWWSSVLQEKHNEEYAIDKLGLLHRVVKEDESVEVNTSLGGFVEIEHEWCGPRMLRRWSKSLPQFERVVGVVIAFEEVGPQTTDALCHLGWLKRVFLQDVPQSQQVAATIREALPACAISVHPSWDVTLPPRTNGE